VFPFLFNQLLEIHDSFFIRNCSFPVFNLQCDKKLKKCLQMKKNQVKYSNESAMVPICNNITHTQATADGSLMKDFFAPVL